MIPLWFWPAITVACLVFVGWWDARRIERRAAAYRAVEAERLARDNAAPLGNVSRWFE